MSEQHRGMSEQLQGGWTEIGLEADRVLEDRSEGWELRGRDNQNNQGEREEVRRAWL
uniref:Uncharacterized protein n=1 Tax=Anguilla anguilla TaxID=7936 RepID=A0A0E9VY08_ANGAN